MNKIKAILALILFAAAAICVWTQENPDSFFQVTYVTLNDVNYVIITGYTGYRMPTQLYIPPRLHDLQVTAIGNEAFRDKLLLTVSIPGSVILIGDMAFALNRLTTVTIPDSVRTIGVAAFAGNQLTSVVISNRAATIREGAFASNQLTSVTIPDSVTSIGQAAFTGNPLISITIGADVELNTKGANVTIEGAENASFDCGFDDAYNNGGRQAGTYTRDADSNVWTRQFRNEDGSKLEYIPDQMPVPA